MFNELDTLLGSIDDVHDSPLYALGSVIKVVPFTSGKPVGQRDTGSQTWVYVTNVSGASIPKGTVLTKDAGSSGQPSFGVTPCPVSSNVLAVVGVSQHVIADTKSGFILREGRGEILSSASVDMTADTPFKLSTVGGETGTVVPALVGAPAFGVSVGANTAGGTAALIFATLNCPGR